MKKFAAHKLGWIVVLIVFVLINFIALIFHARIDLTKEKRYTISNATKNVLKQFDDDISVTVFLNGDLPTGFRKLANTTEDFLQLLKENNNSKISYQFVSAEDDMDASGRKFSDTLLSLGATPINLTVQIKQGQQSKLVFPYALIRYMNKITLVNLYDGGKRFITPVEMNNAEAMMEYHFAKAFNSITTTEKPLLGYSFGNGELTDARTYDLLQTVNKDYHLFTLDINKIKFIPDTFKVLLITKPKLAFTEDEKLKIDQYLLHGGNIICFIDNLNAEQDSLRFKPQLVAYDRNLNLTDLFFKYGARINTDLVMDLQCDFMPFAVGGTTGNPQYEFLHWNYFPLFESKNNHPINRNIGLVSGRFVNSIDTVKAENITKTILLSSSVNSRKLGTPAIISLNENRNSPEDVLFNQKDIPVAVLLEGKFRSLYRNRITKAQLDSLKNNKLPFVDEGDGNGKLIIVADGDIPLNDVSQKQGPLTMGTNLFTIGTQYEYQFANKDFLLNCLEYSTGKKEIIETRNKEIVLRLLNTEQVDTDKLFWQLINIGLPVVVIILSGLIYQSFRRKKYSA